MLKKFSISPFLKPKRWRERFLIALLGIGFGCGAFFLYFSLTNNFHVVVPNELYRSAQLSTKDMEKWQSLYHFKTIINLRGESQGSPWYDQERAAAENLGITHINFRMSATKPLSNEKYNDLISLYKTVEKPILIHCRAGADRSGLASALYIAAITQGGEEAAEGHLSLKYGHFSLPFLGEFNMDETFEMLESSFGYEGT